MTGEVMTRLHERHLGEEWAFFPELRSCTGYLSGSPRYADAIAMNLWPSRGLEVIGFEVKVSRADWLSELKDVMKSSDIQQFCSRWWIVVGKADIVKENELPPTWGLMVPHGQGLRVKVTAPFLPSVPFDKPFIAALLRATYKRQFPAEILKKRYEAGYQAARKIQEQYGGGQVKTANNRVAELERRVHTFEQASGIRIDNYANPNIGLILKVLQGDMEWFEKTLAAHTETCIGALAALHKLQEDKKRAVEAAPASLTPS